MSVYIEDRRTTSPLTGSGDETDFLVDNNGDVITIEIDVRVETYRIAETIDGDEEDTKARIVLGTGPGNNGRVTDLTAIWISDIDTSWEDFHVGDQIKVVGAAVSGGVNNGTYNITEILEDNTGTTTLITDHTFTAEVLPVGGYVANTTLITAITHRHGLIGNDEPTNYLSKVDGSEQVAQLGGLSSTNTSFQTATLLGNKSWQSGLIQIKGNNTGNGNPTLVSGVVQAFTIKHTFINNPLILADEFIDSKAGLKPERLKDEASLRYVFSLDVAPLLKNPNDTTNVISDEFIGNIGWKDENFNGNPTNYSISNLVFENGDNTALELTTTETKLTFLVDNTVDSPFSNNNTKMVFGFNLAPVDSTQYSEIKPAIDNTMEFNFMFDNVLSTLGQATGTPDKFGTVDQVIKSLTSTYISDTQISVDVRMQLSTEIATRLSELGDRDYEIYMAIADHLLLRKDSDKVTLDIDVSTFFVDTTDPTMILMANSFMEHTGSVVGTDNDSAISARAEDDITCITNFALDKNGRETDVIKFTSIKAEIIARKDANTFDVLDSTENIILTGLKIIDDPTYGDVPFVDITQDRGFKTPADDLRKNIRIKRRIDLDLGGIFAYEIDFPMVMRWENWEARPNANDDFFDSSQPNNGLNHDWVRINNTAGWDIFYRFTLTALKNGDPLTFTSETIMNLDNYLTGTEWDTENIKTFIDSTNDPILSGGDYGVSLTDNTRVQAEMTYLGAESFVPADLVAVLKINVFERENFKGQFTISTLYDPQPNTKWLGISPSIRAVITNPSGDIWRTTAILQSNLLDDETTFKITHRLYAPPFGDAKELEDDTIKTLEDDSTKTLD